MGTGGDKHIMSQKETVDRAHKLWVDYYLSIGVDVKTAHELATELIERAATTHSLALTTEKSPIPIFQ